MSEWQPIETATKSMHRILLYVPPYGVTTGHWEFKWHLHAVLNTESTPTHWMPLPTPPEDPS